MKHRSDESVNGVKDQWISFDEEVSIPNGMLTSFFVGRLQGALR
jgi:hypothetical protein